jgi:hypothetical protein
VLGHQPWTQVLTWDLKLGCLTIEEEATNVTIVYGTCVNCFAFNRRSCVNWKGMKLHHFGQWCSYFEAYCKLDNMRWTFKGKVGWILWQKIWLNNYHALKERHIWQLDWMLPMFFLVAKFHHLGNNKNGYVKGPKDSFGGKCTKTPYVCQGKKLSNRHIQPLVPNLSLKHIKFINIFYLYF